MVDLNDVHSLEAIYSSLPPDSVHEWATKHGLYNCSPSKLKALHARYGEEMDYKFVCKMLRSHTRMNDTEREVHELLIRQNPDWNYEVKTPSGFIDFTDNDNKQFIEVKALASYKQCSVLCMFAQWFPCWEPVAILFHHESRVKKDTLKTIERDFKYIGVTPYLLDMRTGKLTDV